MIFPGTAGQLIAAALAVCYGALTVPLPPGTVLLFTQVLALVVLAVASYAQVHARARLSTLHRVGTGQLQATPEHLGGALRQVAAMPDFMFRLQLICWLVGAAATGVIFKLMAGEGASWLVAARMAQLGLLFGPLAAMGAMLWVTLRARVLTLKVSEAGLTAEQMAQALPAPRFQIRGRMVAFVAISVIVPAVMTADVSAALASRTLAEVSAAAPGTQRRVAVVARRNATVQLGLMCAFALFVALATAYAGGTALGQPMRQIAEEATRIARGDLAEPKGIPAEDEVWAVSLAFTTMQANLVSVLGQLQQAGLRIGGSTETLVSTSGRHELGATEQASALNRTSTTTEELAHTASQISNNAAQVAQIAQGTLAVAQAGQASSEAFSNSMGRMRQDNQAISDSVAKLSKRVQQIGRIVEFINGVASKSDLLALNAELEGTKAGEVGQGFSLVAAEMRRLGENVIESTREIEGLIEEIRGATALAVTATEAGVAATASGATDSESVSSALREIVGLAEQTSDAARSISLATQQQKTGTNQLAEAMAGILKLTHQSLLATQQVSSANGELATLARDIKDVVERFKLTGASHR